MNAKILTSLGLLAVLASQAVSAWNGNPYRPVAYGNAYPGYGYSAAGYHGPQHYQYPARYRQTALARPVTPILARPPARVAPATTPKPVSAPQNQVKSAPRTPELAAPVRAQISTELADLLDYSLDQAQPVPRVQLSDLPQAYYKIKDTETRKQAFFRILLPIVLLENESILRKRARLQDLDKKMLQEIPISETDAKWLKTMAVKYRVKGDPLQSAEVRSTLIQHVDVIPASLALAQAANESAWGKSRFATQARNLFGIWTYDESKGLVPKKREAGKKHLVRKFDNLREGVQVYMHTLNSHPAYKKLRSIRAAQRQRLAVPGGSEMAKGLEAYSGIGDRYVRILQDLISSNDLAGLDSRSLQRG